MWGMGVYVVSQKKNELAKRERERERERERDTPV